VIADIYSRLLRRTGGVKRGLVALVCALAIAGTMAAAHSKPSARDLVNEPVEVHARRLTSFGRLESGHRFGRLEFRGGLVLTSPSDNFGGWSGLEVDAEGRRFLAVSDAGAWMTGEFLYKAGRIDGVDHTRMGPILGLGSKRLPNERDRDAEGVRLLEGTLSKGSVLVAFEQNQRIGRFEVDERGLHQPTGYAKRSADWSRMFRNMGLESVAVVRGGPSNGAIVAFAERLLDDRGNHTGWIWPRGLASEPQRLLLRRIGDFNITDAASLPDGSVVVLERSFSWLTGVKMRMRLIKATELKPGAVIEGEDLIQADMSYEIDNMEALAVHRGPRGEAILTVMSDNNFNGLLQRTLVLQFALVAGAVTSAGQR